MLLGNPSGATINTNNHTNFLAQRPQIAFSYNDNLGVPNWVSWHYSNGDSGDSGRSSNFYTDTNLPPNFNWVGPNDYSGSGFDRGHMCPSADRTDSVSNNLAVFFMSNIIPQTSANNSGVWAQFEGYCRSLTNGNSEVLIVCGPSGFNGSRVPSGAAAISSNVWKVVVVAPPGPGSALSRLTVSNRVISIRTPNTTTVSTPWQQYITTARAIELETGFNFFSALPGPIASAYRARIDGLTNAPAPVITSFSPISGVAGSTVSITGTNFNSASVVSFNGTHATYYVDSNTKITATVPTGATTGLIAVTTPGGTATSLTDFTVGIVTAPDLTVIPLHTNTFTQGDFGRNLLLIVTNAGNAAATGTVTLTNILPPSLTLTLMSGPGWTLDTNSVTATRSDSLSPGAAYPAITLNVNVASNAPGAITNTVVVAGGGDTSPGNNTVTDVIPINSLAGVPLVLASWDVSGQSNYGVSPFPPTTSSLNVTAGGLTRGAGVATNASGALRAWGGVTWTNTSSAQAIASNNFVSFSLSANFGYEVSYTSLSRFDYRRSNTGPTNGLLQYRLGSGPFVDITNVFYTNGTSGGATLGPIDLSGVAGLQSILWTTNVTFRIVNWSGTNSAGTWYIFDVANSSAPDFAIMGTLLYTIPPPADILTQPQSRTNNVGETAEFSVLANGPGTLHYQWRFNGTNILSATNTSLILTNVQLAHAGDYSVEVNNGSLSLSSNATLTVNRVPTTTSDVFNRLPGTALTIPISNVLGNDFDADGDPLTLIGLSETSTNGALMDRDDFFIYYTPSNGNVNDLFTYTADDGRGGSANGAVTVRVVYPLYLTASLSGGGVILSATQGVAGVTYWLQLSTNLAVPGWSTIATNVPLTNGLIQFNDPQATNLPTRFYRTVIP